MQLRADSAAPKDHPRSYVGEAHGSPSVATCPRVCGFVSREVPAARPRAALLGWESAARLQGHARQMGRGPPGLGWPWGPALAGLGRPWGPASERRSRPQSGCGGPQRQQHLPGVLCDRSGSGAAFNLLIWSSGKEVVAGDCLWERSRCLSPAGSEFRSVASSTPSGTHGPHRRGRGPHGSRFGGCLQGPRRCAGRTDHYCSVVRVHPWSMVTCVMRAVLHLGRRRCR